MASVDIDIIANPASMAASLQRMQKAKDDIAKGVTGGVARWDTEFNNLSKSLVSATNRSEQAALRMAKSYAQASQFASLSGEEKILARSSAVKAALTDRVSNTTKLAKALADVDSATKKLVETERASQSKGGGMLGGFGLGTGTPGGMAVRSVRDIIEGRTGYGMVTGVSAIGGLEGVTAAVGGLALGLTALEVAGYKAAKSVGDYAMGVHNAEIVTGLTARQVQQFSFAAKSTGEDISVLDRLMRGLTQAVEDQSSTGQKARETLRSMGVDLQSLRSGNMSSIDLFRQLSDALRESPNLWVRNKEAIDVFRRAGISSLPMLLEISDALRRTENVHFMSDEDLKRFREIHLQLGVVSTEWDQFVLKLKGSLAKPFLITLKYATEGPSPLPGLMGKTQAEIDRALSVSSVNQSDVRAAVSSASSRLIAGATGLMHRPALTSAEVTSYVAGQKYTDTEAAQAEASRLKGEVDRLRSDALTGGDVTVEQIKEATAAYEKQKDLAQSLAQAESNRKSILEDIRKLQIDVADKATHPYGRLEVEKLQTAFAQKPGVTQAQVAEYGRTLMPLYYEEVLANFAKMGLQPRVGPNAGFERVGTVVGPGGQREYIATKGEQTWGLETAAGKEMTERLKQDDAENRESIRALESIWTQSRKYTSETAEAGVKFRSTLAPDTIENRLSAESQLVAIKKNASDDEARQSLAKIRGEWETLSSYRSLTHEEALMYTNEETAVRLKNEDEVAKARDQYAQQWAGEIRKQLDEIKGTAESLFHTLFTSPSKFGSQLGTTLKNAALKPIESGLASTVSYALHPLIFGGSGTGGIAGSLRGMFGGGRVGPIGTAVDPVHVIPVGGGGTTVFGGFGMGGGQTGAVGRPGMSGAPGITFGMPGYSGSGGGGVGYMPSFSGIGMFGPMARGGGYQPSAGGDWTGAGGTGGSGSYGGGRGTSDGGGGGGGIGGGAGFGGMTGMLKGLRGQWGIGGHSVIDANGFATGDSTTTFGSVMNSQGMKSTAGAAGMMLAQQGLLGSSRGTWGGVAEGTVGGAGVGFMMGGPLGAAIGAAAGLGIGIGEKIAGVETPQNEAKRLVKSQYGISINNSMANSIVQLARSKYGNTVSIAVRSPEVRQMLGLYAAGTGQRMAQSADMPHGAGLVESGGRLAQEQMYQYGVGHTYSSNLPVEGGGSGSQFPSGGTGNVAMSFNIEGSDISRFMSGNVFTPGATASNYAASLAASNGRTDAAMAFQEPGSIVA